MMSGKVRNQLYCAYLHMEELKRTIFSFHHTILLIFSFGYGGSYQSSLPVVLTACSDSGYKSDFIKYSMEELYTIVKEVKDCSLPEMDIEIMELGIVGK